MDRRRLGTGMSLGLAIATVLWLAVPRLPTGVGIAFGDEPAAAGRPRGFSGKVTEEGTKKPIAGATVKLRRLRFPDPETGHRHVIQETTQRTDAAGIYHFTVPPDQLAEPNFGIITEVCHPDYPSGKEFYYHFTSQLRFREALGKPDVGHYDVELVPGEPITGIVVMPDGSRRPGSSCTARRISTRMPGLVSW